MKKTPVLLTRKTTVNLCSDGKRRGGFAVKTCEEFERDFWLRVDIGGQDECWLWHGASSLTGNSKGDRYGKLSRRGRPTPAHRISFIISRGIDFMPEGFEILHSCNTTRCVNPWHLSLGTHAQNMAQAARDGLIPRGDKSSSRRHPESRPRGQKHPHAKITDEIVLEIFKLRHEGFTEEQIGKKFGITSANVGAILRRKTWGHVKIPAEFELDPLTQKKLHRVNNGQSHRRFSDDDVRLTRKLFSEGLTVAEITRRMGKSYSQIRKIVRGEIHTNLLDLVSYSRTAPRVNVLRGYAGNEPMARSFSAPVTAGITILSGQLMSLSSGSWILGCAAGLEPFIAFADSTDMDVQSSGLLLGLSCAGQYEIETAWFDNTVVYSESSFLVAATGGSSTANVSPGSAVLGNITIGVASANADVIGYAVAGGRQDATAINSQSGGMEAPGNAGFSATGSKIYLLRFRTQWFPHVEFSS
jgi:hypothetical protein